jgi:hypothetical protein
MNYFNDFSIQDELLEDQYDYDEIMHPDVEQHPNIKVFNLEADMNMSYNSLNSSSSPVRGDLQTPLAVSNNIGTHIYKNITGNKFGTLFNNKFCKMTNLGDDIDFTVGQFSKLVSPFGKKSEQCLNSIAKSFNLQYEHLNSKTSILSNNGDSKNNSLTRTMKMEDLRIGSVLNSMDHLKRSEKHSTEAEAQINSCNNSKMIINPMMKLNIPKVNWSFKVSNDLNQGKSEKSHFKVLNGADCDDFSYNAIYVKEEDHTDDKTVKSRHSDVVDKVTVGMNTFCERITKSTTQNDMQSNDDDFIIGRLSKAERAQKVRKYLEKKKRRNWEKQVNYESRKKVADTRPRYKGRFLTSEQAVELSQELKLDENRKLEKAKVFMTEIFDRKTGKLRKVIYPTEEALRKH